MIAPASERQIVRARLEDRYLVRETGAMYSKGLKPMIEELRRDGRSIQWVYNILDGKKETERSGGSSLRQVSAPRCARCFSLCSTDSFTWILQVHVPRP